MFCKWCGVKIRNNGVPCPACGKEQDALENGNGFWDLCEIEPKSKQGTVPLITIESSSTSDEENAHADRSEHQKSNKAILDKRNAIIPICVLCLLMAVVLIESSIALVRTSRCIDEIASAKSELYDLRTSVSHGMSDIEDNINSVICEINTLASENTGDEVIADKWDQILSSESTSLIKNREIFIESHEIDSSYADKVLIISGTPTENKNSRLLWQQYDEQTKVWVTITANQLCLLVNDGDNLNQIRVLCFLQNEIEQYTVYEVNYSMNDETKASGDSCCEYYNGSELD